MRLLYHQSPNLSSSTKKYYYFMNYSYYNMNIIFNFAL
ncbi:hypothetical protein HMPREF1141_3296 [Clostridium sp. MSTE9]|nr:hypothetical protein HMPREF1141_3296 [Clostridium sp. MSTE9]